MADTRIDNKKVKLISRIVWSIIGLLVRVALIFLLVIGIQSVISIGYDFGYNLFKGEAMSDPPGRDVVFTIEQGQSTSEIVDNLLEEGLVGNKWAVYAQIVFYKRKLMPGTYTLNTSQLNKDILKVLNGGSK